MVLNHNKSFNVGNPKNQDENDIGTKNIGTKKSETNDNQSQLNTGKYLNKVENYIAFSITF